MLCCVCFSQSAPGIEWQNTIGGSVNDQPSSIKQTTDGGYIIGGSSMSGISGDKTENTIGNTGYGDIWIIKTDMNGNIQWQNTIGGDSADGLSLIEQTTDGGYLIGGFSSSNISGDKTQNSYGGYDYWIIKTDSSSNIQWQKTYGGASDDFLGSIKQTTDGGYILGGSSISNISGNKTENCIGYRDYWIVKIDSNRNVQWDNTIGGIGVETFCSVFQTIDGGYFVSGYSSSNISGDKTENTVGFGGDIDIWILKTDSIGNIQWQNTIGGTIGDWLTSAKQTSDGNYILGGNSYSNISGDKTENSMGVADFWVLKIDSVGNIIWQNTIGGNSADFMFSIIQTSDNGYLLGGSSCSTISGDKTENWFGGTLYGDYWVVKIDSMGNIQWQNTLGGNNEDALRNLCQTVDGGYALAGWSDSNISGDKSENCIGNNDFWIIKLFPDTITSTFNLQNTTNNIQLYPNPTKEEVTITTLQTAIGTTLKVYNVYGHVVFEKQIKTTNIRLQTTTWLSGVYFISINNQTQKLIKL